MKTLKLLALGSALIGASQVTNGSVLLGFNSFAEDSTTVDSKASDDTPDEGQSGWSGSIASAGLAELGGSSDNYYGHDRDDPSDGHLIYGAPPTADNGYVDVAVGTKFTGVAGSNVVIDALLFDATSVSGNASSFNVSWTFWTDASKATIAGSGSSSTRNVGPGVSGNVNSNYSDFAVNLGSFFLPAGGIFEIVWNRVGASAGNPGNFKLDNIALVPEPGSMLGLGCLVGFGTLLRSRRRTAPLLSV